MKCKFSSVEKKGNTISTSNMTFSMPVKFTKSQARQLEKNAAKGIKKRGIKGTLRCSP